MPVELSHQEPGTFVITASGVVTHEEATRLLNTLRQHPRMGPGTELLADARAVTGVPSTEELRAIATLLRPLREHGLGPVAIVSSTAFVYGVARMFAVFAELMDARVAAFRSMDEARAWLAAEASEATAE